MTDIVSSLFCEVHGEVTAHCLLSGSRWECMEPLPNLPGVCGETRDGLREGESLHGEPRDCSDWCGECGAVPSRYEGLSLGQQPGACPMCGAVLDLPDAGRARVDVVAWLAVLALVAAMALGGALTGASW